MRHVFLSIMMTALMLAVLTGDKVAADNQAATDHIDLETVLVALNSPDFRTRQAAQQRLRDLEAIQVPLLAIHAETNPAAETAISCVRALEHHLLSDNPVFARTAWEGLETLLLSNRNLVRQDATWILLSHWKIRAQLATEELRKHGAAIVLPEDSAAAQIVHARRQAVKQGPAQIPLLRGVFNGRSSMPRVVQVFFTEEWCGDLMALKILQRLPGLQMNEAQPFGVNAPGPRRGLFGGPNKNVPTPVTVFLINGHSLDSDAATWIKGAFGKRIQERGEVMLGITAQGGVAGAGCRIGSIVPFGSGDVAGLITYDFITSVAAQPIRSFEDLVDELRRFSAGDIVDVEVQRIVNQGGRQLSQTLSIPVTLRSWKDYADAVNTAAAELTPTVPATVLPDTVP